MSYSPILQPPEIPADPLPKQASTPDSQGHPEFVFERVGGGGRIVER